MLSPKSSKKSQNNGYTSLNENEIESSRPRPQAKSKLLSKTVSTPGLPPPPPPKPRSSSTSTSDLPPPSFFTSGGGSSCGYYLSAVHKTKRTATENLVEDSTRDTTPIDINHSPFTAKSRSLHGNRPKFKPKESPSSSTSRPRIAALPAKFRAAFEERKKSTPTQEPIAVRKRSNSASNELTNLSLPDIGVELTGVERRPPSLIMIEDTNLEPEISALTQSCEACLETDTSPVEETVDTRLSSSSSPQLSITTSACLQLPVTFAQPPPREMDYTDREHSRYALKGLSKLREEGHLCDITLIASEEIKAHRIVLAASSSYFESMLIGDNALPDGEPIFIEEIDEECLPMLVDFAYTSQIKITDRNVYSIHEGADVLGMSGVKSACCKFLKQQMNKSNCIGTWLFAEDQNSTELMESAQHYIESNFLDIARGREFLILERPEVVARIAAMEDIAITSEEQVYEAALGWVNYDPERRKCHAPQVFEKVRFPSMSRDFLLHIVDHEPLIKEDPDLVQQLIDALESLVTTDRATLRKKRKKKGSTLPGQEPRHSSMAVEKVVVETDGGRVGIRIMGGADRPKHVFRQGDRPGIFILEMQPDGPAKKCGRLRVGDRILTVNSEDVNNAKYDHVIHLLKTSTSPLMLLVRHEAPPPGLMEITLVIKSGEGFGFSVCGGLNSPRGNPLDDTDEGIFISQIVEGGAAEQEPRLSVGTRILQVNSQSLLGKTHEEALQVLHEVVDRMRLLCCHGYDPTTQDSIESSTSK